MVISLESEALQDFCRDAPRNSRSPVFHDFTPRIEYMSILYVTSVFASLIYNNGVPLFFHTLNFFAESNSEPVAPPLLNGLFKGFSFVL